MNTRSLRLTPELTVFLIGLAVNIAIVLAVRNNFPFEDSVDHLTRYVLMARAWSGHGVPYIEMRPIPGPYLGLDLIGAVLATVLSPAATLKVIAVLVVSAIPIGFYLLLAATGTVNRGWALVGVVLGFGFFTHVGFMSYTVGLGLTMAWLAAWWPHRKALSPAQWTGLTLGLLATFLFHLSAPLMILVVIWLDMMLAVWYDRREHKDKRWRGVLLMTAILGLFVLISNSLLPPIPPDAHPGALYLGTPWSKLRNILTPFYVYGYGQALVSVVTYLGALVLFLRTNPRPHWIGTWGLAVAAFVALYLIFPPNMWGTGYLDMRWLMPAFLLPFCMAEWSGNRVRTSVLVALLVGSVINSVILSRGVHTIDRELDDYATALERLPPGRNVFPVVADEQRWGPRVIPYRHFAFWYQIENGGRVPSLFNFGGDGGGAPPQTFMPYFQETAHLYPPPGGWSGGMTRDTDAVDWSRVTDEYDYVIVAGNDPRMHREVAAHARPDFTVGEIAVYAIARPSFSAKAAPTPPSPAK